MAATLVEIPSVAKKTPKRMGRPPSPEGPRANILNLRGRQEFKDWLAEFSYEIRLDMADIVYEGVKLLAKTKGFRPPPER